MQFGAAGVAGTLQIDCEQIYTTACTIYDVGDEMFSMHMLL
jgi:hypothetical protein